MIKKIVILCVMIFCFQKVLPISFILPCKKSNYKVRKSSYPYISGDTFREFCDFVIDETHILFDPSKVCLGNTIFLKSDYIDYFFSRIHPHISTKYILITHNSDAGITPLHLKYLDDHKLIAWFGQNALITHPKLFPIPIGLANRYWPHGNISTVRQISNQTYKQKYLAYLNCTINTNISERKEVYRLFASELFCFVTSGRTYKDYLIDIASSHFTFSPAGNGLDCHRTWEALYMGSIAIVKRSPMDAVFDGLPVIIVDDWQQITKDFLEAEYKNMQSQSYAMEKLYADYWFDIIESMREQA